MADLKTCFNKFPPTVSLFKIYRKNDDVSFMAPAYDVTANDDADAAADSMTMIGSYRPGEWRSTRETTKRNRNI